MRYTPAGSTVADVPPFTPEELAKLPHNDAAPVLVASLWSLASLATVFLTLRVYCRFLKRQYLWWDDGILIASWVCVIIESAIVTHTTKLGYGHHIWDLVSNKLDPLILPANVANTFLITGSVWSKTSFGLTLLRITEGWYRKFIWFCIISMNIAMFLSALFLWTSCTPIRKTWDTDVKGSCWDQKTSAYYNIFASGYSALMDFTLALLPCRFLWTLPIQRKEKIGAGLAMGMGVVAGIMAVIKTTKIPAVLSTDFADTVPLWCWGNAEISSSIIAASIPMLRVLVRDATSSSRRNSSNSSFYDKESGFISRARSRDGGNGNGNGNNNISNAERGGNGNGHGGRNVNGGRNGDRNGNRARSATVASTRPPMTGNSSLGLLSGVGWWLGGHSGGKGDVLGRGGVGSGAQSEESIHSVSEGHGGERVWTMNAIVEMPPEVVVKYDQRMVDK
ncbi:hypothetical protein B0J18DRAFT_22224 [Chaetomium sp. MPI-SDFR-AT-0129]|nr:hypothetical protein B0J18DRAFT_22224 [Chaetomium sp. MPI-SDFR-AT-0129]